MKLWKNSKNSESCPAVMARSGPRGHRAGRCKTCKEYCQGGASDAGIGLGEGGCRGVRGWEGGGGGGIVEPLGVVVSSSFVDFSHCLLSFHFLRVCLVFSLGSPTIIYHGRLTRFFLHVPSCVFSSSSVSLYPHSFYSTPQISQSRA